MCVRFVDQTFRGSITRAVDQWHGPTQDDERILREAAQPGESTSDTLRRALRLLDHERWLAQFRADAEALKDEDVNAEPDAW